MNDRETERIGVLERERKLGKKRLLLEKRESNVTLSQEREEEI